MLEKGECIFSAKNVAKIGAGVKQQRKRRLKNTLKVRMPITFVKGNYFGTPLYTMC